MIHNKYAVPTAHSDDDDCSNGPPPDKHLYFFEDTSTSRCITAYLDERIRDAKFYRPLLQSIYSLGPNDSLQIIINSYGGDLDGALSIISAIKSTDANVTVCIDGAAASAASLIALVAPTLLVSEYSTMMIHSATFGSVGKQSDVISHATFMDRRIKSIMQDIYKDFLTDQEMQDVMTGREIWLDAEGIGERLMERQKKQQARYDQEQEREVKPQVKTAGKAVAKPPAKKVPLKPSPKAKAKKV